MFLCDFGTVPTIWHYLFLYWTLELFRQCGIICFSIGHWNFSDSVALFVYLFDFGNVPTVWHYLFFDTTLELFDSLALFVFLLDIGTVPTVWHYLFFYCTFEQFWQCEYYLFFYGVLELFPQFANNGLSIGLWNWSDSLTLLVFLLDV